MNAKQKRKRLAAERRRRAAFVARGLRSDGLPRVQRKPCGCLFGSCLKCATPDNKLIVPAETVAAMWKMYEDGASLSAVAREFNRNLKSLSEVFARRGYQLRPSHFAKVARDPKTGKILPYHRATEAEIERMIRGLKHVAVPRGLALEWRRRPMAWRMKLIARIRRAFFGPSGWAPHMRPSSKFSENVTPFDYGTPEARGIVAELNRGRDSRNKVTHLRPVSQGVIYQGRLWFWAGRQKDGATSGYVNAGKMPECSNATGRMLLHHHIWEQANHRRVPAATLVIFMDGNPNNLAPSNLGLRTMAENAKLNHWRHLPPERRAQMHQQQAARRTATMAARAKAEVSALVSAGGLMAALNGRSRT